MYNSLDSGSPFKKAAVTSPAAAVQSSSCLDAQMWSMVRIPTGYCRRACRQLSGGYIRI